MIIRSKAPLRIGLAGGGSDVSPYSDLYGGAILNATIDQYAYATLEPTEDSMVVFHAVDKGITISFPSGDKIPIDKELPLHCGIYNRIVSQFTGYPLSFRLTTHVDAPPGSGLGSSSTLVTAIVGAFAEWLKLPFGEYDIARLAYEIERLDLMQAGGKQDQYAATFGGINFMEFSGDKVIVNPLRIRHRITDELAHNLVLYYTETSRLSSKIIETQTQNVKENNRQSIEAMHKLKEQAVRMKEALLKGEIDKIGAILDFGWKYKKKMANGITNSLLDDIYSVAMEAGSTGGKVSGAGGGGFMFFYCPGVNRYQVIDALKRFGGQAKRYEFTDEGLKTWTM